MTEIAKCELCSGSCPRQVGDALAVVAKIVQYDAIVDYMSNEVLADAILHSIWYQYDVHSKESALLGEAIERLRGKKP